MSPQRGYLYIDYFYLKPFIQKTENYNGVIELGKNEEIDELLTWDWVMEAGITVREKLVDYLEKVHEEDEKNMS